MILIFLDWLRGLKAIEQEARGGIRGMTVSAETKVIVIRVMAMEDAKEVSEQVALVGSGLKAC